MVFPLYRIDRWDREEGTHIKDGELDMNRRCCKYSLLSASYCFCVLIKAPIQNLNINKKVYLLIREREREVLEQGHLLNYIFK